MGGIRSEQLHAELPADAVSRIAPNWDEDLLLPRHWNTDGHTHGVLAPGGWIAKTDPEGKTWEIVSIGYRNPYDAAFNADGELFVYDSDMEWDYGMPWYRPTRVAHATSGSDFGWRNGTAKWPPYYVDSLPPALEAGPGCPTGVEFGRGAAFPEKYQRALFICDWTYGIMYAVHLQPEGASYRAIKEEFLSRAPLALTDLVIGDDGAMYFIIGGRGVPSELFRVTYTGPESTSPVDLHDERGHELRELRQEIETYQRPDADPETAVAFLTPQLAHPDRFIRYAARVSLERIPVDYWQDSILGASEAESVITGVVGLARQAESAAQPKLLAALDQLDWSQLDESQQLELLRAYQLVITRLGLPEEPTRLALGTKFDALFPTASDFINRELAILMVGLGSPRAADKIVPQLERARSDSKEDWSVLLSRNSYGDPLAAAQTNRPDAQQISYGYALRNLKTGWTPENQNKYFDWFERARTWTGGASYQRHIEAFENDALENDPDRKLLVAEAQTAHKPPPLPKPIGPGKDYTVDDLVELAQSKSQGRSFENGKRTFAAARCVVCHRFGDTGGAIGPDLTQVAGRFGVKEVAEAIIEPSKVVSDQYKATIIQTYEGQTYQGRIVSKTMDTITLLTDPEDLSKSVSIDRTRIEEQKRSTISLMPKDLLKPLNPTEVADLLAYILSRGNPRHPAFNP
jgi:putative heme-binding domain-containing protein